MIVDQQPFLDMILAQPDDDGPRLVYSDWLEEQGECDHSEFIRVQCELAGWVQRHKHLQYPPSCRFLGPGGLEAGDGRACDICLLRCRERELLNGNGRLWVPGVVREACGDAGINWQWRRGFVEVVTLARLADWVGEPCPVGGGCDGTGRVYQFGGPESEWVVCRRCRGTGRRGRFGPALVRAAPLVEIKVPGVVRGAQIFCGAGDGDVPNYIFDLLRGGEKRYRTPGAGTYCVFESQVAGEKSLSDALLLNAKSTENMADTET